MQTLINRRKFIRRGLICVISVFIVFNIFFSELTRADEWDSIIIASSPSSVTNYTSDANCMGAWYMNGGLSANGDSETDRSGESGTLTESSGDIPNSATVSSGYSGNSRDFERADTEYLSHADGGSTDINGADQPVTVAAWAKNESIGNGTLQQIAGKYDYGNSNRQYVLYLYGTNTDQYEVRGAISNNGTGYNTATSTVTNYASGTWHHFAVVYNDTDIRVYVDGSLACTPQAHTTGIYNGSASFRIGTFDNVGSPEGYFDGLLDEVIVFNRELSSAEISDLYTNGIDGTKGGND